jgi:hypothetical protein
MSFVATAIVGGSVITAGAGIYGSIKASDTQAAAESNALAAQNQARGQLEPWINVGTGANYTLGSLYGIGPDGQPTNAPVNYSQFTNSPDYQFAQQQGNAALQNYENANGLAGSGGALAAASQYNEGLATQQYGNYFNRLMSLSTLGQGAASAGVGGANAAASTIGNIGASTASGIVGATNAVSGGVNSAINNSLLYQNNVLRQNQNTAAATNPSSFASPASPIPFPNAPFSAGSGG